jgi:hypothetical protein
MDSDYWQVLSELIRTPFRNMELFWGIVPLYFALLLNEMTSAKASFRTAVQTGFSFLWAGVQWLYPYFKTASPGRLTTNFNAMVPVSLFVTFAVLILGVIALISGLRRHYPKYFSFLGYTRFSNYFMIMIFPMQAHYLNWSWDRVIVVATFALPVWLVLHFGLMPLRK